MCRPRLARPRPVLALAAAAALAALCALGGCGEDVNENAFDPNGPCAGTWEMEPNGSPDLAQILNLDTAAEFLVCGNLSGMGLTSGELDFYKLVTPAGGPFQLAVTLSWQMDAEIVMILWGNGVTNIDGFTPGPNPQKLTQEVGGGLAFDFLVLGMKGTPGNYELKLDLGP